MSIAMLYVSCENIQGCIYRNMSDKVCKYLDLFIVIDQISQDYQASILNTAIEYPSSQKVLEISGNSMRDIKISTT